MNKNNSSREIGSIITLEEFDRMEFVISDIHKGGMGIVYQLLPVNPFFDAVALKSYQQDQLFEEFEKEARIWFSVADHPNIAQPFWYGLFDGKFSILAEWYPISACEYQISTSGISEFQDFIMGILSGLRYAYEKHGVIHRDIKPGNILLGKDRTPKINDFGISSFTFEKEALLIGTEAYMAPELFVGYPPSLKTDIFAVGATLFELVTKQQTIDFIGYEDRKKELHRCLKRIGSSFNPILELILASIQEAPSLRASSYEDLMKFINYKGIKSRENQSTEIEVTGKAAVLLKQGNAEEAIRILVDFLQNEPDNSIVLSTLGNCYLRMGILERAILTYEKACTALIITNGKFKGTLLPDPFANLASLYLDERRFEDASHLLESLWQIGKEIDPRILYSYPEIGWYLLYQGNFEISLSLLLTAFQTMKPNHRNIQWLILSACLSGKLIHYRMTFYSLLMDSFPKFDTGTALQALLVANVLENQEQRKLQEKIFVDCYSNLRQIADELDLGFDFERFPLSARAKTSILTSMDYFITGGKFYGSIR